MVRVKRSLSPIYIELHEDIAGTHEDLNNDVLQLVGRVTHSSTERMKLALMALELHIHCGI